MMLSISVLILSGFDFITCIGFVKTKKIEFRRRVISRFDLVLHKRRRAYVRAMIPPFFQMGIGVVFSKQIGLLFFELY